MRLTIYNTYRIIIKSRSSYRVEKDEFDEELSENVIHNMTYDQVSKFINEKATDEYACELEIIDNIVHIEGFNPTTGEDYTYNMEILKELEEEKEM